MSSYSRIRVLIMHHDPLIAAGLVATLGERQDCEVVVRSPAAARPRATGSLQSADVIVADYDSGLRLIHARSRRVLILTQTQSEAEIRHAVEQGARGYMLQGCSLEELVDGLLSVSRGGTALCPVVTARIADSLTHEALTAREADVLRLLMLGLSNKAIAGKLAVGVGTIKSHVKSILAKLDVASRTEAVAVAQRRGILRGKNFFASRPLHATRSRARARVRVTKGAFSAARSLLESPQSPGG